MENFTIHCWSFHIFKIKDHHFSRDWVHCVNGPSSVVSSTSSTVKLRLDVSRTRRLTVRCSSNARWFGRGPYVGISLLLSFASLGFLWTVSVDQVQQSEQGIPDLHEHDDGVSQLLQDNLNVSVYVFAWFASFFFECPLIYKSNICNRGVGSNQNKGGQTQN